jgi:hypothetical protein
MQQLVEPESRVAQQNLRILEPLFVVRHGHVNLLRKDVTCFKVSAAFSISPAAYCAEEYSIIS